MRASTRTHRRLLDGGGPVPLEEVFADERANLRALPTNEADGDHPDPDQALRESIEKSGVLQPVGVARAEGLEAPYRYRLVFGFRRFRAAKALGLTDIPAVLVGGQAVDHDLANLTENMVRANLAPWELMEALHRLRQMHPDLPTAELARASGRSSAHVSNLLRLRSKLCPELLEAYQEQGHLMHLGALLSVCAKEPAEQVGLYNTLVSGSKGGRPTGSTKRRGKNEPATYKQIQQMFRKARRESKERPSVFLNGVVYALLCVLGKERFELEVVE